jgi:hypothetical protein
MARRPTAREQEHAAAARPSRAGPGQVPSGEVLAALARRGFRPTLSTPDLPFPPDLDRSRADALADSLGHYAFRLFLRGAIQHAAGFRPQQATRYLAAPAARAMAEDLVRLGLAEPAPRGRYRLRHPARSFGGTLEWYVAHELRRRLGFDVAHGLKFGARGVGGDLDVVAAAEGRLVYLELKSSPPRHLQEPEVAAFFDRLQALGPDAALFVVDTALRLGDKVVPLLAAELARRRHGGAEPRRVGRELWALAPRLYAIGARPDLLANIGRAISDAFRSGRVL